MSVERQIITVTKGALRDTTLATVVVLTEDDLRFDVVLPGVKVVKARSLADVKETEADVIVADKVLVREKLIGTSGLNGDALDDFLFATLSVLRTGGALIVREDVSSNANPLRTIPAITDYVDVFRRDVAGKYVGYDFYVAEQVEAAIHQRHNFLDFIWVLTKQEFTPPPPGSIGVTFRDFLDKTQYTHEGIGSYEWIFGKDFISPGGYDENLRVLNYFGEFEAGRRMLDIGSGIGGGVLQATEVFGISVTGIDLSANMLAEAIVRVHERKDSRVKYAITDALKYKFPENHYDYVFSRDCIQHIPDKEALFRNIFRALRPGGTVVISMYGRGKGELTAAFKEFVDKRVYFLLTLEEVQTLAKKVGFTDIFVENMTPRFKEILTEERDRLIKGKDDFFKEYTQKEYDSLYNGWSSKLKYIEADNHNWNIFRAVKPLQ